MIDINKLRKLTQEATPGPWKTLPVGDGRQKFAVADSEFLSILTVTDEGGATFGTVYDDADAKFIAAANPAAISELIDCLEAAESECLEEARLNGIGSEREAALMAKLEAAEKTNREWLRANAPGGWIDSLRVKCEALRAKIEAMGQQKPVGCVESLFDDFVIIHNNFDRAAPVYLAAGAQPAPIIPEGWKLVPTAESRHPGIYKMLGALHTVDNTPGASEWESYAAFLAAVPEAKP